MSQDPIPNSEPVRILIVGTMDTKADEVSALAGEIRRVGGTPVVLDSGVGRTPITGTVDININQSDVALAGGVDLADVWAAPRGEAIGLMRSGVTAIVKRLGEEGRIDGALCMGGAGTHAAGPAFQALPLSIPKLIVTPLASGSRSFEPYVGTSNVAVMHSVVDIAGLNPISETIYRQAAGYIVGAAKAMQNSGGPTVNRANGLVAISMNGNTTPAVNLIRRSLEGSGFNVVAYHANGVGGRSMEEMIDAGEFVAVIDMTTTELAGAEFGGLMDPGPHRMEAAGRKGIPQVLVPGCLDFITVGRLEEAKGEFPDHVLFAHNPELTLVRMKTNQMVRLGEIFASKANSATGPTTVCVPTRGLSVPGAPGGPFSDPEADQALQDALTNNLRNTVKLRLVDAHINDASFAEAVLEELNDVMSKAGVLARNTNQPRSEVIQ